MGRNPSFEGTDFHEMVVEVEVDAAEENSVQQMDQMTTAVDTACTRP